MPSLLFLTVTVNLQKQSAPLELKASKQQPKEEKKNNYYITVNPEHRRCPVSLSGKMVVSLKLFIFSILTILPGDYTGCLEGRNIISVPKIKSEY